MISPLRWLRRKLVLEKRPFPPEWLAILETQAPFYPALSEDEQERLRRLIKLFIWERYFFGAGGFEMNDEARVLIAASACRLILHLDLRYYNQLTEIIVYPSAFVNPQAQGVHLGESHWWGIVVLAWDSVVAGLQNQHDGSDTALHEFAHVLDRSSGAYDGTPPLHRFSDYYPWARVLTEHYLRLQERRKPQRKALREYGATNEAEFFAVATEVFFETPQRLWNNVPDLYEEFARFYRHDPLGRLASTSASDIPLPPAQQEESSGGKTAH